MIITIKHGGKEFVAHGKTGDPGPHAISALDGMDGVEVRGEVTARIGDGVLIGDTYRDARLITITGWTETASAADTIRVQRELAGMFPESPALPGQFRYQHEGLDLTAEVHIGGAVRAIADCSARTVDWMIPLRADDPHLYGPERRATIVPAGAGGGLQYPLDYPLSYGGGAAGGAILTNNGNTDAYPRFTVALDDPSGFSLTLSGRTVEVVYPVSASAPITVDMRTGTVTAAGGGDITMRAVLRQWASVPPGGAVTATIRGLQGGEGHAVATIRDTYL